MSTQAVAAESVRGVLDEFTRVVPDWPVAGVTFRDLTPVIADPRGLSVVNDALVGAARAVGDVDVVVAVESRGFWFGPALALALGVGCVPARKPGKLPGNVHSASYDLEYGTATLELPSHLIQPGQRVLIVDDVLATGGTLAAATELVSASQAVTVGALVLIELADLDGRAKVAARTQVISLATY